MGIFTDMKTLVWSLFILILVIWTGMTSLTVHLVDWIAQTFGSTPPTDLGSVLSTIPVPPWLALWIDPVWIQSIQSNLVGFIETMTQTAPYFASAIDWLSPLLWAFWGLGALLLLSLAIAGHWRQTFVFPAARHVLHFQARKRNPAHWSGCTRNWALISAVTLNSEREAVIKAHFTQHNIQPLAA